MNLLDATIDYERRVRIRQGFDLLDAHGPSDWRPVLEANAEYLDMGDSHGCALGMIYGNYWKGLDRLGGFFGELCNPEDYGFDSVTGESYAELTATWVAMLS